MSPELQKYLNFKPKTKEDYDEKSRLRSLVNPLELKKYFKSERDKYFIPENEILESRLIKISPSGKYTLQVTRFKTSTGWEYSQGKVYKSGSENIISIINRNYGSFPFLFIEDHPNGHDYLICGEDYQGQTVIELDSNNRVDYFSNDAYEGFAFCISAFICFDRKHQILMTDGCYWACPYEYRFYDFSNPMHSLNEFETKEFLSYDEHRAPTIELDGTIKVYQSDAEYVTDDNIDCDVDDKIPELASVITYKIENNSLIKINEWVSEKEIQIRQKRENSNKEWEIFKQKYTESDPIWLKLKELCNHYPFKSSNSYSVGYTYDNWCPHWKGEEKRFCKRIYESHDEKHYFDIEIAHLSGPIKIIEYKNGKNNIIFFEHSISSLEDAVKYVKKKLT